MEIKRFSWDVWILICNANEMAIAVHCVTRVTCVTAVAVVAPQHITQSTVYNTRKIGVQMFTSSAKILDLFVADISVVVHFRIHIIITCDSFPVITFLSFVSSFRGESDERSALWCVRIFQFFFTFFRFCSSLPPISLPCRSQWCYRYFYSYLMLCVLTASGKVKGGNIPAHKIAYKTTALHAIPTN